MPCKYACFISYRNDPLVNRVVDDLYQQLSSEFMVRYKEAEDRIFLDKKRMQGGFFLNRTLARSLYESICMVLVFVPAYFSEDKDHLYCAQEYITMEKLEEKRLKLLSQNEEALDRGLIIIIVLRGEKRIPEIIKKGQKNRLYYVFNPEEVPRGQKITEYYEGDIKQIADYIIACCKTFKQKPKDPCSGFKDFRLPKAEQTIKWLNKFATESYVEFPI
jgi:hypothetical protein